jgi:hypothetical protein
MRDGLSTFWQQKLVINWSLLFCSRWICSLGFCALYIKELLGKQWTANKRIKELNFKALH